MKHPLHVLPHFAGARFFILLLGRNMIYLPNDKKARVFLAACNNAKIYTDVLLRKGTDLSMYKRHLCHVQTVSVQDTNADL
ncbi:hypothetical protein HMPREF0658_1356 [Hoylesella marshii DSM 16973 = JCM 13450]|uniref:Uncharacterized protein n=1 Tax=Hoylesella marshii DSM 16973 = JCM 13450 TaxID=862515 RepID=E0NT55_9BACT|nr:hypothetical protein HMPREF0658_1356 [Hoylesella marshii DSM 16973 = JCM 13450]